MVGLAGLFAEGENYGSIRMNAKTIFRGTGSEISALSMGLEIPLALCTLTESGFVADVIYVRSADGLSWLPIFRKHYHDDDTDAAGGLLFEILRRNIPKVFDLTKHLTMHLSSFGQVHVGGGMAIDIISGGGMGTELRTSTNSPSVANDAANIVDGGPNLNLANRCIVQWKGRVSSGNTSILHRLGIGMEYVHNSPDNTIKFGVEGCDGDGINLQLVSADTVGRTKVDTGAPIFPSATKGYRLDYNPALKVQYDDSDGFTVSKTSNVPSSGSVPGDAMFRAGIKTTTTTQHRLLIRMLKILGNGVDSSWF
jgi:hypothetical protein